jgi:hypothetical protein
MYEKQTEHLTNIEITSMEDELFKKNAICNLVTYAAYNRDSNLIEEYLTAYDSLVKVLPVLIHSAITTNDSMYLKKLIKRFATYSCFKGVDLDSIVTLILDKRSNDLEFCLKYVNFDSYDDIQIRIALEIAFYNCWCQLSEKFIASDLDSLIIDLVLPHFPKTFPLPSITLDNGYLKNLKL